MAAAAVAAAQQCDGGGSLAAAVVALRRRRKARRRQAIFDNIEIEEEEIGREYVEGALPLVAMPLLLHAHLLVQGQGF